jgi:hypothetical protein
MVNSVTIFFISISNYGMNNVFSAENIFIIKLTTDRRRRKISETLFSIAARYLFFLIDHIVRFYEKCFLTTFISK